jgi:lipopolysaccharide export system protein LptA
LERLFPPGSWPLKDPIKLENDHSILLMKDYHNLPDGRVEMFPCAIVFFPADSAASNGEEPQGRVIVLDAPAGAIAQFDQPLDLQKGKIGRLLGAQFHGPVTIRGTPSRPGATDDILVTTQNVQMNTDLIWTPEPVDFRFGQSTGHGRDLQMHLLPSSHAGDHGAGIGGIQTIDLLRDVQMRLVAGSGGIMPLDPHHHDESSSANSAAKPAEEKPPGMSNGPIRRTDLPAPVHDLAAGERQQACPGFAGTNSASAGRSAALPTPKKPNTEPDPPTDIRCKGKFRFDMVQYLATFEDQVDVLRTPHDGPGDQMTCDTLIVHFAPRDPAGPKPAHPDATASPPGAPANIPAATAAPAASPNQSGSSDQKIPNLEPRRIEARGKPVILRAPSNGSYARGEHLDYDIRSGQLTLDGGDEVIAQQHENEIHGRSIVYQPGEAGRLGRLLVDGAGWLRGVPPQSADKQPQPAHQSEARAEAPAAPQQLFEAHWSRQLKMRPYEDNHVISLLGDARAGFTGQGELSADEIHLWLLEPPPADKSHPAPPAAPGAKSEIQPDRMLAIGQVRINSPQLMGSCGRLEAWFQQVTTPAAPRVVVNSASPLSQSFGMPAATGGAINAPNNAANTAPGNAPTNGSNNADAPFRAVASQNGSQNGSPNGFMPAFGGPQTRGPQTGTPQRYEVDGQRIRVQLLTQANAPTTVEDLAVDGQVHLVEIQTPLPGDLPLHVSGDSLQVVRASEPDTGVTVSGRPAQVASRGMEMYGDVIRLDKGTNRLWIDGPGRMKLPANQVASDDGGFGGSLSTTPRTAPRGAAAPGAPNAPPPPSGPPIFVDWQGRMAFDGLLARFERSVVCQTETRNLRTELLDVTMRQRVNFSQAQSGQRTDVGRIFCHGDVLMESRGFDLQHLLTNVERLRAHDLTVDEVTGLIDGQGPGWLTSVRKGSQDLAPGAPTNGRPPAASPPIAQPVIPVTTQSSVQPAVALAAQRPAGRAGAPGQPHGPPDPNRLTFLNVQFQGPITGNVNDHEITFHDQVHTIYGPVLAWEDQLNFDKVADLGPDDELMHCDQLTLRQGAIVQQPGQPDRRPMEMEAVGNVSVEGATFHALANRMTYAEAKDLLILEGDGRVNAELYRYERVGAPPARIAARKILYWRMANQVSVNDARFFDLDQGTTATAPPSVTGGKTTPDKKPAATKKPPPATGTITP